MEADENATSPVPSPDEETESLPVLSLLSCTSDEIYTLIEEVFLKQIFDGRFTIKATGFYFAEDFLDAVRSQDCDLAGIALNDVRFREEEKDFHKRMHKAVELITTTKAAGARHVFATTGIPVEWLPDLEERVKDAGADFFLRAPFDMEDFKLELERCLEA